jgi:predicted metal-dependent peptidase
MPESDDLHRHRGTRAIQRMVEFAPSTGGLALWVRHEEAADDAPLVATDGNTLFYGPGFARLSIAAQVGLVAHEVLHIGLRHPQRFLDLRQVLGDIDLQLFNICADAIVNSTLSHLSWLQLPAKSVFLDQLLARALGVDQSVEKSLLEWDVERLYRAIDDRRWPQQQGGKRPDRQRAGDGAEAGQAGANGTQSRASEQDAQAGGKREDGQRAAQARALGAASLPDLQPGTETQGAPEAEAEQAREWSERILRAHTGDGAHSMLRTLIADLPRNRTPWEQVLRTQLTRSLAPKRDLSWSRPSRSYIANQGRCGPQRRMPWEPGYSSTKSVPRLVVIVDVSGSIEDDLMERFANEIEAITRRLEAGLVLVIGDEQVRSVTRYEPGHSDLRQIEFLGGGGTDFTPLLEEAERHGPDIVIVLTDLQGPANFRPRWPVIWAVPEAERLAEPPFGRKLVLN